MHSSLLPFPEVVVTVFLSQILDFVWRSHLKPSSLLNAQNTFASYRGCSYKLLNQLCGTHFAFTFITLSLINKELRNCLVTS